MRGERGCCYTDLVPPQSVFVVAGEAVDHNRDGEGQDEDTAEGAEATYQLAREGRGGQLPIAEKKTCQFLNLKNRKQRLSIRNIN